MMMTSLIINKLTKPRYSLMVLPLLMSAVYTPLAQAELIIHSSKDNAGRTSLLVTDDKQKELPPAQLGITPARIAETVSLVRGTNTAGLNQSLTLYNYGNKPKKIALNLIDIDASGAAIAPSETTLKPFTLINPTQFTIAPNGYQTVRLSIRPPMSFATGKHVAMLEIKQQVDNALTYDADGKGVTLEIGSRYGLPIIIEVN